MVLKVVALWGRRCLPKGFLEETTKEEAKPYVPNLPKEEDENGYIVVQFRCLHVRRNEFIYFGERKKLLMGIFFYRI